VRAVVTGRVAAAVAAVGVCRGRRGARPLDRDLDRDLAGALEHERERKAAPSRSGPVKPISMMCRPPGARRASPRAGTSMAGTGRIRATPSASIVWLWSSTVRAAGLRAATRRSAASPTFATVA
jgi:hypothetical protein